jgi:hypothetical protein
MADIDTIYQDALTRWLGRLGAGQGEFAKAEQPLTDMQQLFAPGGGYGAGQRALIEQQAKLAGGQAATGLVASGMSSGSNAAGLTARIGGEKTRALLGVEDTRTQNLADIMKKLSGLRGGYASQLMGLSEPTFAPYMGATAGIQQTGMQNATSFAETMANIASREKIASMQPQTSGYGSEEIPTLHL